MGIKILIIEDQLLIAEDIAAQLEELDYDVVGIASNHDETMQLMKEDWPDLIISDIMLGEESGIDIVTEVLKIKKLPIIYLTGNSETITVKKAMKTQPAAYMVKPFKASEFSINIDLAIHNFKNQTSEESSSKVTSDSIFVPNRHTFVRIKKKDIYMVVADGSYIKIYLKDKKYQLSTNLKNFIAQLDDPDFLRISRKYLINTNHVHEINGNAVYVGEYEALLTKANRQEMLKKFPILKTKIQ